MQVTAEHPISDNAGNPFAAQRKRINAFITTILPNDSSYLTQAMRYAVLNGGKRIRPLLVYASGFCFAADEVILDHCAAAIELIHTFSLVHDDLPAMDNDDFRRGKPTCHRAFDEATAILAGDALQALAFELLSRTGIAQPSVQLKMLNTLAMATGHLGMTGGQALDLQSQTRLPNHAELMNIYRLKTGRLIHASVKLGALAGNASEQQLQLLDNYAEKIGLAFQLQDDLFDAARANHKQKPELNYLSFNDLTATQNELAQLQREAMHILRQIDGEITPLSQLTESIFQRKR